MTKVRFLLSLCVTVLLTVQVSAQLTSELLEKIKTGTNKPPILEKMLAGPMKDVEHIIFCIRIPGRDHWYVSFGNYCGPIEERRGGEWYNDPERLAWKQEDGLLWGYGDGTALVKQNIRTGELEILMHDERGGIRDPQLHYDGQKILMSYRPGGTHVYHLYEIDIDGKNLHRLTDGIYDDVEPTYCPDGTIVFCSARCKRFVNCWHTPVATLYRCDADGKNVRLLSSNNDHDNTPWLLPDGRVLYMRWEYVDRSQVDYHHLWTMNPDGTQQIAYYGNQHPGIAMLDAKPIPNTDKVVASFSMGHGNPEHMGRLAIVSPKKGPDDLGSARLVGDGWFKDPYAFSEECFLTANNDTIWIVDGEGRFQHLYGLPQELRDKNFAVHEPRPVGPRPRETIIGDRTDLSKTTGLIVVQDVHRGQAMQGLEPGTIKKLLVMKQLPKPINFSGGMEPLTIGGSFTLAEILGTIPVAEDGSAYAELPALQSIFFVALDENDIAVKRMHSFLTLQPGETFACIGCHEERTESPPNAKTPVLQALLRSPSKPEPIPGVPPLIDYPRDVQPVFDKHCVSCHSPENYGGKLDLTGDKTFMHSMSFIRLTLHGQWVVDNRNQAKSNFAPYKIGSGSSTLLKYIEPQHYDVKLSAEEKNLIRLWIDTSATYTSTYASLRSGSYHPVINCEPLVQRCGECHASQETREGKVRPWEGWHFPRHHMTWGGTIVNISRPDQSFLLRAPLAKEAGGLGICSRIVFESKDDPVYQETLRSIERTHRQLLAGKRFDMPGFRPNGDYIREMQKYGFVKKDLAPDELFDYYQAEREYFDSFYYDPVLRDVRSAGIR
jgi:cytochrome c553